MADQFKKHYTVEEARALLPQIRQWLGELNRLRQRVEQLEKRIEHILSSGNDAGGDTVNELIRHLWGIKKLLDKFQRREIQLKDLERGLIDFPAIVAGREVFLCWEQDEDDIEYWHDLDTGYAGREKLPGV
jgi:hypothetical protein